MNHSLKFKLLVVGCVMAICLLETPGHHCRWALCPYKNVMPSDQREAVIEYTGCEEGTDSYCIDMLHLQYPDKDYDQLEEILFNVMRTSSK